MNIPETVLQAVDLMTEGQFEKSERLLKKVFSRDPENFDAIHASALVDIGKAQPRRGLKKLRKLTERATAAQMGQLTNSMGLAYKGLGEFESALRCFREVYAARPDSIEAGLNLAFCLQNLGRHEEEAEVCRTLKKRFPGDYRVQFLAVRCRYDLGEVREALDEFMSLGDTVDLSVYQYEQICHLLERHYRYDDLRAMATAGLQHYPESVTLTINLSRCHLENGEFEAAVSLLEARAHESKGQPLPGNGRHSRQGR
jgi:tetratricopeptide (TPR) repeat protein